MNVGDCLRVLGVTPNASPDQIRQAYQDLVRVWHPDRFQSESRLQQIAQERLREINEAYSGLKNYSPAPDREQARRATDRAASVTEDAPGSQGPTWTSPPGWPQARRRSVQFPYAITGPAARTALIGLLCAIPFLMAVQVVRLLRAPVVDAQIIAERALKPDILAPMRIIDPSSDVRVAANMITEWARGDVIDLWRCTPASLEAFGNRVESPAAVPSQPMAEIRKTPSVGARSQSHPVAQSQPVQLANGTELIDAGRAGRPGYLRVANQTNLEALVRVVSDRTTRRAIYVRPGESAVIRSVKIGLYDLHVELGNDLDVQRLRFRKNSYTPEPLGPFEFLEVTSENGVTGSHYDVALSAR